MALQVIQQHGFVGILMLASWPNAAFDLCGICCGAFKMPFIQFFGATVSQRGLVGVGALCCRACSRASVLAHPAEKITNMHTHMQHPPISNRYPRSQAIGKGVVKVNGQTAFFVALFRHASREAILGAIGSLLPSRLPGLPESAQPPAAALRRLVDGQIQRFQRQVGSWIGQEMVAEQSSGCGAFSFCSRKGVRRLCAPQSLHFNRQYTEGTSLP